MDTLLKYRHNVMTGSATTTSGPYNMTRMATGNDADDRQGRKIALSSMELRGLIKFGNLSSGPISCRLLVYSFKGDQASAPTVNDVLDTTYHSWLAPYNKNEFQHQFKFIHDEMFTLHDSKQCKVFDYTFDLLGHIVYYRGTTSSESSCGSGGVYFQLLSDQTGTAAPTFEVTGCTMFAD